MTFLNIARLLLDLSFSRRLISASTLFSICLFPCLLNAEPSAQSEAVNQDIEELVSTLEDPESREKLVSNLKLMLEKNPEDETSSLEVSEWFDLDEKSQSLVRRYFTSLEEMGLTPGESGRLLIFAVVFLIVLVVVWCNRWLARWLDHKIDPLRDRLKLNPRRFALYFRIQTWFGYLFGLSVLIYGLSRLPEAKPPWLESTVTAAAMTGGLFSILLIALLFVSVWEFANFVMEYGAGRNHKLRRARLDTLLPVARNALLVSLSIIAALLVLSELGVDIMPLLAGAGVLGIAVGFGAQTLVKELINGFVVIFEDLVAVGDVVRVGGRTGVVERITIRKMQLRDLDGTVSTVPFSEVDIVDNLTKDYSYYLMDVGVAYREDVDDVMACLRDIDKKMREDDSYKDSILEELEILGVNEFADSAVFIRCRTKTKAHDKWWVGREFNRRMKAAFDEQGIEIPFPHQTLYFGEDKEGKAPAGRLRISRASDSADGASAEEGNGEPSPKKKPDAAEPSGEKKDSAQVKEREGKAE